MSRPMGRKLADVEFHSDGFGRESHPAINVKYRGRYPQCPDDIPEKDFERITEYAWTDCAERFWEDAKDLARERGYAGVYSEGRQGGWLVPYYGGFPIYGGRTHHVWYPVPAESIAELSRFHAFRVRIEAMLSDTPAELQYQTDFQCDLYREDREFKEALAGNYVDHEADAEFTAVYDDPADPTSGFTYSWEYAS